MGGSDFAVAPCLTGCSGAVSCMGDLYIANMLKAVNQMNCAHVGVMRSLASNHIVCAAPCSDNSSTRPKSAPRVRGFLAPPDWLHRLPDW